MKKTITMLIAGFLPFFVQAQSSPVTVQGDMKIAGEMNSVGEMYLRAGSAKSASVENNGTLLIPSGITFNTDAMADGLLMNKGSITPPTNAGLVRVTKKMDTFRWYNISLPFDVLVSSIVDAQGNALTLDTDYYLNYYDAENRAKLGTWDTNGRPISHWKDITDPNTVLKKGVGYQIAYDSDEHPSGLEVAFPAQNVSDLSKLFSTDDSDKVLTLDYYTSTNFDIANTSWGINFVGSLTTTNFLISAANLGGYVGWIQYYDNTQKNYAYIDIDNDNVTLPPYVSFFTQTADLGETITYKQTGLRLTAAEAGIRSSSTKQEGADIFTLSINGSDYSDRVKIYSGSTYSESFSNKEDVIKFLSPAPEVPKVWIKKANESLLVDKAPYQDVKKYALGVQIETPGEYSFSSEDYYEGQYQQVLLTDNATGSVVDLLGGEYLFSVDNSFSSNDRFSLEMILKTTGMDELPADDINVYVNDLVLYVEGCQDGDAIAVYTTTGQLIGNYRASGNSFSQLLPEGVLIVKIAGKEDTQVVKVISE